MKICGIEAGGTKFVLGLGDENGNIFIRETIPTESPEITINACKSFILKHQPDCIGIASFGPIDLDSKSPNYGSITSTPKPGWSNTPLVSEIKKVFSGPIGFDTDVNGAALGESIWGKGKDVSSCLYLTNGTGIGGGGNGKYFGRTLSAQGTDPGGTPGFKGGNHTTQCGISPADPEKKFIIIGIKIIIAADGDMIGSSGSGAGLNGCSRNRCTEPDNRFNAIADIGYTTEITGTVNAILVH